MADQFFTLNQVSRLLNLERRRLIKLADGIQPAAFNGNLRLYRLHQFDHLVRLGQRTSLVQTFIDIP
jgi:hypothetical protein